MDMPTAENASKKAELTEAEVDRICPPRPETAAPFKAGTYPPAARPYREAALRAFAYMASLPAMRTLVETGEPEQTYQHNAYVSKTHAAHIVRMLEWARREPARRDEKSDRAREDRSQPRDQDRHAAQQRSRLPVQLVSLGFRHVHDPGAAREDPAERHDRQRDQKRRRECRGIQPEITVHDKSLIFGNGESGNCPMLHS